MQPVGARVLKWWPQREGLGGVSPARLPLVECRRGFGHGFCHHYGIGDWESQFLVCLEVIAKALDGEFQPSSFLAVVWRRRRSGQRPCSNPARAKRKLAVAYHE